MAGCRRRFPAKSIRVWICRASRRRTDRSRVKGAFSRTIIRKPNQDGSLPGVGSGRTSSPRGRRAPRGRRPSCCRRAAHEAGELARAARSRSPPGCRSASGCSRCGCRRTCGRSPAGSSPSCQPKRLPQVLSSPEAHQQSRPQSRKLSATFSSAPSSVKTAPPRPSSGGAAGRSWRGRSRRRCRSSAPGSRPEASQLSSTSQRPCSRQKASTASRSKGLPSVCASITARVRGPSGRPRAARRRCCRWAASTSTKTGTSPCWRIGLTVVGKPAATVITSSPAGAAGRPSRWLVSAAKATRLALEPELTSSACGTPSRPANSASNAASIGPRVSQKSRLARRG